MAVITLRSIKLAPLTIEEVDNNFTNLNTEIGQKLDTASYTAADVLTKLKTVDGAGSGLDADTLDGFNTATAATANTVVLRDSSGNFAANVITGNQFIGALTGNASGTASNVTGIVAIVNGGTGANSSSAALDNLFPSGEVSGHVLKTAGPGSYYWAAETGALTQIGTRINTSRVSYVATAGQTLFTGTGTYTIGSGQLRVYINGVRQFPDAYTETSTSSFTLTNGVTVGTKVLAEVDSSILYDTLASGVTFSPTGSISSTNVQNAIVELDSEKAAVGQQFFIGTTQVAINRASASLALAGTTVDGLNGGIAGAVPYQSAAGTTAFTSVGTAGQVLKSGGAAAPTWGVAGFTNIQIFETGSGTWTIPPGITACKITVVGGGGGGGGRGTSTPTSSFGAGGGGGGTAIGYYTNLTPGNTLSYSVGTGGAGGGNNGASGSAGTATSVSSGTQTISTISAGGGSGGASNANNASILGGAGGTASGGSINILGQRGSINANQLAHGGATLLVREDMVPVQHHLTHNLQMGMVAAAVAAQDHL